MKKALTAFWAASIVIIGGFIVINQTGGEHVHAAQDRTAAPAFVVAKVDKTTATAAEYAAVEMGMTYREVVDIIGTLGELSAEYGEGPNHTTFYTFKGEGHAVATFTFKDGIVAGKTQFGLK